MVNQQPNDTAVDSPRCYQCFRPRPHCFCEAIPRIDNRTNVLILQHMRERSHPFNTARIVRNSLSRCQLIADYNDRLGNRPLPIQPDAGLLFPSDDAAPLDALTPSELPSQLVIVDGTWSQAQTIVRDVPQLQRLPRFRLSPSSPGRYRIRREPDDQSLSTLEATVSALRIMDGPSPGLDQLLAAFERMVQRQLPYPQAYRAQRRKRQTDRASGIPHALLQPPETLVVAYGEATPLDRSTRAVPRLPVNWFAERLGTGERFSCFLKQDRPLDDEALRHMGAFAEDFTQGVDRTEFAISWRRFLRPGDTLIVYHSRTLQMLSRVLDDESSGDIAQPPRRLVLKSLFRGRRNDFRTLEQLLANESLSIPTAGYSCRAEQRLQMAATLVQSLLHRARRK